MHVRGIVTSTVINRTIFHSTIPFEDSIRRFLSTQVHLFCCYLASIVKWTAITSTVAFNDPSDSSPTIFYHCYNVIDPFDIDIDIDTDHGVDAAVMLLLMMVMMLLFILPIPVPKAIRILSFF